MKSKTLLITVVFLVVMNMLQSAQAGLAAAVIVQRTIINQCILKAEPGTADMNSLIETYGQEAASYLYIKGLNIFDVTVKFENQGELVSYACAEFFPELAPIHFYRGNWGTGQSRFTL